MFQLAHMLASAEGRLRAQTDSSSWSTPLGSGGAVGSPPLPLSSYLPPPLQHGPANQPVMSYNQRDARLGQASWRRRLSRSLPRTTARCILQLPPPPLRRGVTGAPSQLRALTSRRDWTPARILSILVNRQTVSPGTRSHRRADHVPAGSFIGYLTRGRVMNFYLRVPRNSELPCRWVQLTLPLRRPPGYLPDG